MDRPEKHMSSGLDSESLLEEVRYWDRVIEQERARSSVEVLAQLEEHRAWAMVRLLNLVGEHGAREYKH